MKNKTKLKIPKKERTFLCQNKEEVKDSDIRENIPIYRELVSLLKQFKSHVLKLKLSGEDKKKLYLLIFYLDKVVEHYDVDVPEFSFSILCSLIEAIGKYDSPQINGGFARFELAIKKYFDSNFVNDPKFMKKMREVYYSVGRCSFSHAAERLHWSAQIGSQANMPLMKDTNGEYTIIGNKHLFQITITIITSYFEKKQIN